MTTYEKSQALSDAGIKFPESDFVYVDCLKNDFKREPRIIGRAYLGALRMYANQHLSVDFCYPFLCDAPSMEDLWERLPKSVSVTEKGYPTQYVLKQEKYIALNETKVGYYSEITSHFHLDIFSNTNPCNALADLLLWCKSKGHLNN